MRIIAGSFRGRRLKTLPGRSVRPTGDRMKASLFSALGECCRGAAVLDLFAGSGALGLEALSRGARRATFVDRSPASLEVLRGNAGALGLGGEARLVRAEAMAFLRREPERYDLVFADPPFAEHPGRDLVELWAETAIPGALLVLEYPGGEPPCAGVAGVELVKTAAFGRSAYCICLRAERTETT